jgi:hypothetical protein
MKGLLALKASMAVAAAAALAAAAEFQCFGNKHRHLPASDMRANVLTRLAAVRWSAQHTKLVYIPT